MSSFQPVRDLLARVRRRWRVLVALRSSARTGLAVSAVVGAAVVAAFIAGASAAVLAVVTVAAAIAVIAALAWGLSPIREVPSDARVARFIEERDESLNDRLVSAAEMANAADAEPPTAVRSLFASDVIRRAANVDSEAIVPSHIVRRAAFQTAASILLLALLTFFARGTMRRGLDALSLTLLPSSVTLEVTPGSVRLPVGSPLTIEARLRGNSAPVVASVLRADADGDVAAADWAPVEMAVTGDGGFTLLLEEIEKPFRYRVAAGSIHSDIFEVQIARPPRVERIDVEYVYPEALRLPARIERDGGDIYAPTGSEVRIHVHAEGMASSGSIALAGGRNVALTSRPEGLVSEPLKIVEDGSYRVALSGADGLTNPGDTEYFIRMLEDRPPDVHVLRPARDRAVTSLEEVEIEAEAEDDHGVDRLELVMTVRGGPERVLPMHIAQGETAVSGRHTLYLEDLNVNAGDFISYYVRARDVARGKRPSVVKSDIFFLEIKPFEQEFTLARSQGAGMGGGNRSVDDLVAAQKEIIVATWKLDRRAEAARGAQSAQDIRAVARAESELKTRVERTSSSFRDQTMRDPRRAQPTPGVPPRPAAPQPRAGQTLPEEDAMTAAARAMGTAVTALERLQTDDALAPEMEALNHLLRAQADVKRREVTRQQAGGGAGQNRTTQDLSSLFDRDLQRQQQTNYETPTTTEQRDSEDGMLDRIRDLARRQDEMLRQQQELARRRSRMTEEQIKRELERLTREQTELRQRAEEMARQLDRSERQQGGRQNQQSARQNQQGGGQRGQQPAGQSQQGGGQSQGTGRGQGASSNQQSASERMRQASEAMGAAAGELRREDPRQATASGGRALQQLQELQQQMQASLPDERRRAMGDMQLEARQMADEQRRIAAQEAKAGSGGQAGDTRRRLAGEQDRLADRLRRLQSGLDQQAAAPASDAQTRSGASERAGGQARRNAAREASREIERQQLTERMKQSADDMRGGDQNGSQAGGQAQRERDELARALDRLAERIAAGVNGADPQSQRATDQLTRAQDLRDRIESLTREAERLSQQSGAGGSTADGARLRDEYQRQLQETRELLDQISRDNPEVRRGGMGFTFEGQGMVMSAPGTEPFKQDFAKWDELRKQVTLALDQAATELSRKLQARDARERLAAGADDKPPASYQQQVDSYFKALAEKKTP